jgi:hypothetical protein
MNGGIRPVAAAVAMCGVAPTTGDHVGGHAPEFEEPKTVQVLRERGQRPFRGTGKGG